MESKDEEELQLEFNWKAMSMKNINQPRGFIPGPLPELLMFGLPHHQERIVPIVGSTNEVIKTECVPTIHGPACLILGGVWSMIEHLHRIGFNAPRPPRPEMVPDIQRAVEKDLDYDIPINYKIGAGDTYFSGKVNESSLHCNYVSFFKN